MAQWGKNDVASNSVLWAPSSVNLAPTRTNANLMFGNTTADSFESGETIGMFLADDAETTAARAAGPRPAHAGWVLRTEGSGGRAGRVTYETLVAMTSLSGDAEDVVLPDLSILIGTQLLILRTANRQHSRLLLQHRHPVVQLHMLGHMLMAILFKPVLMLV
jgi:hypothetical protein